MDKAPQAGPAGDEAPVPAKLLASLLIERALTTPRAGSEPDRLTLKIYAVMAATTLMTFATLVAGYQLLFTHPLFA